MKATTSPRRRFVVAYARAGRLISPDDGAARPYADALTSSSATLASPEEVRERSPMRSRRRCTAALCDVFTVDDHWGALPVRGDLSPGTHSTYVLLPPLLRRHVSAAGAWRSILLPLSRMARQRPNSHIRLRARSSGQPGGPLPRRHVSIQGLQPYGSRRGTTRLMVAGRSQRPPPTCWFRKRSNLDRALPRRGYDLFEASEPTGRREPVFLAGRSTSPARQRLAAKARTPRRSAL